MGWRERKFCVVLEEKKDNLVVVGFVSSLFFFCFNATVIASYQGREDQIFRRWVGSSPKTFLRPCPASMMKGFAIFTLGVAVRDDVPDGVAVADRANAMNQELLIY
jgi:hypothetical protein